MRSLVYLFAAAFGALLLAGATAAAPAAFVSPGQLPALKSSLAANSPLLGVAVAGSRIVAVGQRGIVVGSDDAGANWRQAEVPLSYDLVAVSFPSAKVGWAVGHGGVLVGTVDGGRSWRKHLDGRELSRLAIAHFEKRLADGDASARVWLDKERKLASYPGTQPLMDVYFENESVGYVVGTFNRIFETRDGGASWTPLMDRADNPGELHFYSVRGGPAGLVLTGEQGKVWVRDAASERFLLRATPFSGTLFGSVQSDDGALVVFGMAGVAFQSRDRGQTWKRTEIGSPAGITAGTKLADGSLVLVNVAGQILVSSDGGATFRAQRVEQPMAYAGIVALSGKAIALVGAEGVRTVSLPH